MIFAFLIVGLTLYRIAISTTYQHSTIAEWKNFPSPGQPEVPRVSWYMLQLMAPLRWWTRPQTSSPHFFHPRHHYRHHPPSQNTLFPLNTPLCGDITTLLADSWWHAPGASCVSMRPHTAISLSVRVNSSSTYTVMELLSTPLKECSRSILQKYFLKYNTVYSLAPNLQASVNSVMTHYRTEEQLINVKPSVCHHTYSNTSSLKAVLFLVWRNESWSYAILLKIFKEHVL